MTNDDKLRAHFTPTRGNITYMGTKRRENTTDAKEREVNSQFLLG